MAGRGSRPRYPLLQYLKESAASEAAKKLSFAVVAAREELPPGVQRGRLGGEHDEVLLLQAINMIES